ncbi:MAG: hypothetical protein FH751_17080 [Firmicutes bacterium]|nr:hypothetical protein [Bacillota bacterium]
MKRLILIIMIITLLSLTGCVIDLKGSGVEITDNNSRKIKTGDLKTFSEEFDIKGQSNLKVDLNTNAGEISLTKTSNKLFKGNIKTNIVGIEPRIDLRDDRLNIGYHNIRKFRLGNFNNFINKWHLEVTDKLPLTFDIDANATKSIYDLTDLMVKEISIDSNASDVDIFFNKKNKINLDDFDIEVNAGNLEVNGLSNAKVKEIEVDVNAGNATLNFDGDIENDLELDIKVNVGSVSLELPKNAGIFIRKDSQLLSLDIHGKDFEKISSNEFKTINYDEKKYKIDITIEGNASSIDIK